MSRALDALYEAWAGRSWLRNDGWRDRGECDCRWGVACNDRGEPIALWLESNGLVGRHGATLMELLPSLSSLRSIHLANNSLDARMPPELVAFVVARCGASADSCSGLPPFSCSAFGAAARLSATDPNLCDPCDEPLEPTIALMAAMATIAMLVRATQPNWRRCSLALACLACSKGPHLAPAPARYSVPTCSSSCAIRTRGDDGRPRSSS